MKTYLRILSYAGAIRPRLTIYLLSTLVSIFFGLVNLSLFIPLLEVLFGQPSIQETLAAQPLPGFSISLAYLRACFSYHFVAIIATHGRMVALYFVCTIMIIAVLLANLFKYLAGIIVAELRTHLMYNMRKALFSNVLQLHMGYFTHQHKGDVMARIMGDMQEVENAMNYIFRVFFKDPSAIIGFFIVLFFISPQLTWLALFALPIIGGGLLIILMQLLRRAIQSRASFGRLTSVLEEAMESMRMIKALAVDTYIIDKFAQENKTYAKLNFSMLLKHSLVPLSSELLGVLVMTLLLAYGGKMVFLNTPSFTASTFITYIIIFSQALVPIKSISRSLSNIQRGLAAGKRIFDLLDTQSEMVRQSGTHMISKLQQAITFKQVQFVYDHGPVVKHLNLTIEAGKKTALVGPSGGGKSTIVSLLSRLYDVNQGSIQIDGIPLQSCDISTLRQHIGIATQKTVLFHDTIFNNIALGRPGVSKEAVMQAAHIAHAQDFIMALPQGYQTVIGPRGGQLSSGQKQRIGIARAVLNKPSVLVLDEATSSLDRVTEQHVQEAIEKLMKDKTLLIVAHRLGMIRNVDAIFVIDDGKVVAHGTHAILMQQEGWYKQMYRLACQGD